MVVLFLFPVGFLLGLAMVLKTWPPSAVNHTYGYRTRRSMASQEAWVYAQVRSTELIVQCAWWMVPLTAMIHWRFGLEGGMLWVHGAMTAGVLFPLHFVERELKRGQPFVRQGSLHGWGVGFSLFLMASTMVPIQHAGSERERHETGTLSSLRWSTRSADVFLRLQDDDTHYYINRGLEMGLDTTAWQQDVVGREITLHVVDRPAGLNWFGSVGPVRGVVLAGDTLYRTGTMRNP